MPFPPPRDHSITSAAADALRKRYRDAVGAGVQLGFMYPREVFEKLLAQPGCAGIRVYDGRDDKEGRQTVVVGVDQHGNDMVEGLMFGSNFPCPPYCGDPPPPPSLAAFADALGG